jgi:hypothetical protein
MKRPAGRHEYGTDSQLAGILRHQLFTVGSALRASVWFLLSCQRSYAFPPKTRVLVDLSITEADFGRVHQVINKINGSPRRIEVGYRPSTRGGRPIPSPTPVSLLKHYRPTRLDDGADPTEVDLAAIAKGR